MSLFEQLEIIFFFLVESNHRDVSLCEYSNNDSKAMYFALDFCDNNLSNTAKSLSGVMLVKGMSLLIIAGQ
jgi:hypothetical protein